MKIVAKTTIVSTMLTTIIQGASAEAASSKVSPILYRVDGRPVPVSCLEALVGTGDGTRKVRIDLQKCGNPKLKPEVQADGSIGYEIPDGGYFYYRYVGQSGGTDVLSLQSSGGGSGHFTELVGVKHTNHYVIRVRGYAGGDRCNGGISDEAVANGKLTFDQAITPYDLVQLGQIKAKLAAYKDLEASAASCIGVVHRFGDDMHWKGVSLTQDDWPDQKGWTNNYRYQVCFNKLFRETISAGHADLDKGGTVNFANMFAKRCVEGR